MSTSLFKILIFLKRRPGMSRDEFLAYYEGVHSKLCEKYASGASRYVRRYVTPVDTQAQELDFDVITELWFEDRATFDMVVKFAAKGVIPAEVLEDETRLFDRSKSRFTTVIEYDSNLPSA